MIGVVLICWWLIYKKQNLQKKFLLVAGCWLLATFIIALPIGVYFLTNSQDFASRATGVSVFTQESPIKEFGKSLLFHLGMFNFYGDGNWRHNFSGSPLLLWPIGIFFLIGLILSVKESLISLKRKDFSLFIIYFLLLTWFFVMLLPGILTSEGIPHALRAIGVIPVIYIFAAFGAYWLFNKIRKFFKTKYQIIALYLCISILLIVIGFSGFNKYFYQWGKNPEVENAFSKNFVEIGNYLNSLPEDIQKYVIVNQGGVPVPFPDGIPVSAQTLIFIERTKFIQTKSVYLLPKNLEQIKINKRTIIVPLYYDEDLFQKLYLQFPNGELQEKQGVWIYEAM